MDRWQLAISGSDSDVSRFQSQRQASQVGARRPRRRPVFHGDRCQGVKRVAKCCSSQTFRKDMDQIGFQLDNSVARPTVHSIGTTEIFHIIGLERTNGNVQIELLIARGLKASWFHTPPFQCLQLFIMHSLVVSISCSLLRIHNIYQVHARGDQILRSEQWYHGTNKVQRGSSSLLSGYNGCDTHVASSLQHLGLLYNFGEV